MLEGITAGLILSLSLFPGTVWLVRVGYVGTPKQVYAVGAGFLSAQFVWLFVAIPGLMMMCKHLSMIRGLMHTFAAFTLLYLSIKFFRTRRADHLDPKVPLPAPKILFRNAFSQSFAIPMRLPAAMAIVLATGVYTNHIPSREIVPSVLFGGLIGTIWWWGKITLLSVAFAKKVPEPITLKSLNKIRPFCGVLFLVMAGLVLFFGL